MKDKIEIDLTAIGFTTLWEIHDALRKEQEANNPNGSEFERKAYLIARNAADKISAHIKNT